MLFQKLMKANDAHLETFLNDSSEDVVKIN